MYIDNCTGLNTANLTMTQRWPRLFEDCFAFCKWKLCRVDRQYADAGSRIFQATTSSGAWVK